MFAVDTARFVPPPSPRRNGTGLPLAVACAVCALLAVRATQDRHLLLRTHGVDTVVASRRVTPSPYPPLSLDIERAHRSRYVV